MIEGMASKRTKGEAGSGGPGEDAHRAAQELFFQAMDAPTEAEAVRLGRRALEADPLCVDAFLADRGRVHAINEEFGD